MKEFLNSNLAILLLLFYLPSYSQPQGEHDYTGAFSPSNNEAYAIAIDNSGNGLF